MPSLSHLNDTIPVLLLPVRAESRFMTVKSIARHSEIAPGDSSDYLINKVQDRKELWIRIYPDDIAYHSHEEELTEEEIDDGKLFWEAIWGITDATELAEKRLGAWRGLMHSYGQQRAAWVVRVMQPLNLDDPAAPPDFPTHTPKAQSWTITPESHVLPERFVVRLYQNGTYREIEGNVIPDPLTVGFVLSEEIDAYQEADGKLNFPEEIRWLTDFEEAEAVGMGIRVSLDTTEAVDGFDRLVVLGVKTNLTPSQAQTRLENLFEGHHFGPSGISLLPQGTPTNQSEGHPSGYSAKGLSAEAALAIELGDPLFSPLSDHSLKTDGQRLTDVLGIAASYFYHIGHSDRTDTKEAISMNKALWPATLGYFLEQMLFPLLSESEVEDTRAFFQDYVLARGHVPAFRIGNQPYGILPTTAFSKWTYSAGSDPFCENLYNKVLTKLQPVWNQKADEVKHIGGFQAGDNTGKEILEILGLHGGSVEIYQRGALGNYFLWNLFNFSQQIQNVTPNSQILVATDKLIELQNYFQTLGIAFPSQQDPRVFDLSFFPNQRLLNGPIVDEHPLSEKRSIRHFKNVLNQYYLPDKNYLGWLAHPSVTLEALKAENYQIGNYLGYNHTPPRALLYLMLRQSLMLEYLNTAYTVSENQGVVINRVSRLDMEITQANLTTTSPLPVEQSTLLQKQVTVQVDQAPAGTLNFTTELNKQTTETELNNVKPSKWDYITAPLNETENAPTIGEHIETQLQTQAPEVTTLADIKAAIGDLQDLPTARLARTFLDHLDCSTYRLDAWMNGLIQKRLTTHRATNATGIHLGAFSWLEEVRPGNFPGVAVENISSTITGSLLAEATDPEASYPNEVVLSSADSFTYLGDDSSLPLTENTDTNEIEIAPRIDPDNQGFIHAPSLSHAVTAAILRSGYNGYEGEGKTSDDHPLAVNLNSERVRKALFYLDGVQQGQSISELLGYQFERGLFDNQTELPNPNAFIYALRLKFPLITGKVIAYNGTVGENDFESRNVVDGLQLLTVHQDDTMNWDDDLIYLSGFTPTESEKAAVEAEINQLANDMDAIGDLALVEGIYQVIQGKYDRAAAFLEAMAGKSLPQRPEVIDTPRQDQVLTQRMGVAMDVAAANPTVWPGPATVRSLVEPTLNAWVGKFLPPDNQIRFKATYAQHIGDPPLTESFMLQDLSLQPIDFVYLIGGATEGQNASELSQRITDYIRTTNQVSEENPITLSYMDRDGFKPTDYSIFELQPMAEMLVELISQCRALTPLDFVPATSASETMITYNLTNLELALSQVLGDSQAPTPESLRGLSESLLTLEGSIDATLDTYDAATLTAIGNLRDALRQMTAFGLTDAWPETTLDNSQAAVQALIARAQNSYTLSQERIQAADAIWNNLATDPTQRATQLTEMAQAIFGANFKVLPPFTLANAMDVDTSFNHPDLLAEGGDFVLEEWMQGVSKVRSKALRFSQIEMLAEAWEMPAGDNHWAVAQLPLHPDNEDRWLGIEFPPDYEWPSDPLSCVMHKSPTHSVTDPQAGLMLEEWIERIPEKELTTGLAMNIDQPNSEAPQSLLLAVTPIETGAWDWEDLIDTVNETLDRAKERAVDPELLKSTSLAQLIPMVLAPISEGGAGPSLDFGRNLVEVEAGQEGPINPFNNLGKPTQVPGGQ